MKNKLTLTELLAKRICESDSHNITEDFAEEIATVIHEEYQYKHKVDMTDNEWSWLLSKLGEYIDEFLIDDAEKLAEEWTEDNEEWIKEREEASHGQY